MHYSNKQRTLRNRFLAGAALFAGMAFSSTGFAGNYHNCIPWQLHSYGGEGGVRTLDNPGDFRSTSGHTSGQFCGSGSVRVELSKRHQNTGVVLIAGGYEYHFGQGDRGNRRENHWFRKYVTVDLPYQQHYSNQGYGNKHYKKHHKKPKRYRDQDYHHGYHGGSYDDDYYDNGYGYYDNQYKNSHNKHRKYAKQHRKEARHHRQKVREHRREAKKHQRYAKKHRKHGSKHYDYVDHPSHDHGYGIAPKPRLRIGSDIHRKAHRLKLPHRHKKAHYAYH